MDIQIMLSLLIRMFTLKEVLSPLIETSASNLAERVLKASWFFLSESDKALADRDGMLQASGATGMAFFDLQEEAASITKIINNTAPALLIAILFK
jgi:hypothetical protein